MASKESWLLQEAGSWRREGLIDEAAHQELNRRYAAAGEDESGVIRWFLYILGGIVLFLGVFFIFAQFWDHLNDTSKFAILLLLSLIAMAAGGTLALLARWRPVSDVGLAVGAGLLLFSFVYVDSDFDRWTGGEVVAVAVGFALGVALAAYGHRGRTAIAGVGPIVYFATFTFFESFGPQTEAGLKAMFSWLLASALVWVASEALIWSARSSLRVHPPSVRAAAFVTALFSIPALLAFVFNVIEPQDTWTGILLLAALALALGGTGVAFRLPELVVVGGVALVGDALWAGFDKGDLLGTSVVLVVVAVGLIALAQSGFLRRWLTAP
jgi:uncharacterized membrane protein